MASVDDHDACAGFGKRRLDGIGGGQHCTRNAIVAHIAQGRVHQPAREVLLEEHFHATVEMRTSWDSRSAA